MTLDLTTTASIGAVMLASLMWGSWFVCLKHLRGYPLDAFFLTMMAVSLILVWTLALTLEGSALPDNMAAVFRQEPSRVVAPFICGFLFALGMRLSLRVQTMIGLALTQPMQLSVIILVGTWLSGVLGGLPEGIQIGDLVAACLLLIGAVVFGMLAAVFRNHGQSIHGPGKGGDGAARGTTLQAVMLATAAGTLIPAYAAGLSHGLGTVLRPHGLTVLGCMTLLVSGGFLAALMSSGRALRNEGLWHVLATARPSTHGLGAMAGLCHYGGNVIYAFASVHISTVVAWPLGLTSGLWTELWGLAYGEFRGAPRRAYVCLFAAMGLYLAGALLVGRALY